MLRRRNNNKNSNETACFLLNRMSLHFPRNCEITKSHACVKDCYLFKSIYLFQKTQNDYNNRFLLSYFSNSMYLDLRQWKDVYFSLSPVTDCRLILVTRMQAYATFWITFSEGKSPQFLETLVCVHFCHALYFGYQKASD